MKSSLWYIFIVIYSLAIFILTLWRKRSTKLIAVYVLIGGATYAFEYIVLVLLNSYVYSPGILGNQYFDNIMGAVVSDGFSVPMMATFVAAYQLKYIYMLGLIGLLAGNELLFLHLGIYKHYWWKEIYTVAGLLVAFSISKWWYKILQQPLSSVTRFITLFFANLLLEASVVFILSIFNKFFYTVDWFQDPARGHVAFATIYVLVLSFLLAFLVTMRINWIWVSVALLSTIIPDVVLLKVGILSMSNGWTFGHFIVLKFADFVALLLLNNFLLGKPACTRP